MKEKLLWDFMLLYVFAFSFQWDVAKLRLVKSSSVYPIPASPLSGLTHPNQAIFIPAILLNTLSASPASRGSMDA